MPGSNSVNGVQRNNPSRPRPASPGKTKEERAEKSGSTRLERKRSAKQASPNEAQRKSLQAAKKGMPQQFNAQNQSPTQLRKRTAHTQHPEVTKGLDNLFAKLEGNQNNHPSAADTAAVPTDDRTLEQRLKSLEQTQSSLGQAASEPDPAITAFLAELDASTLPSGQSVVEEKISEKARDNAEQTGASGRASSAPPQRQPPAVPGSSSDRISSAPPNRPPPDVPTFAAPRGLSASAPTTPRKDDAPASPGAPRKNKRSLLARMLSRERMGSAGSVADLNRMSKVDVIKGQRATFLTGIREKFGLGIAKQIEGRLPLRALTPKDSERLTQLAFEILDEKPHAEAESFYETIKPSLAKPCQDVVLGKDRIANFNIASDHRTAAAAEGLDWIENGASLDFVALADYTNGTDPSNESPLRSLAGPLASVASTADQFAPVLKKINPDSPQQKVWNELAPNTGFFMSTSLAFVGQFCGCVKDLPDRMKAQLSGPVAVEARKIEFAKAAKEWVTVLDVRLEQARTLAKIYNNPKFQDSFPIEDREFVRGIGRDYMKFLDAGLDPNGAIQKSMAFALDASEHPENYIH